MIDFNDPGARWRVINDSVMGGVSQGSAETTPQGTLLFRGHVSLENSGGFSSCRLSFDPVDMTDFEGIALRVRGDGKRYGLSIRTHDQFDGINHRMRFRTQLGEWTEIRLPFSEFRPEFRGRALPHVPALDTGVIQSIGFIISEGQEGPFLLEVDRIEVYRRAGD
ncbi:CIA30 family protein [Candidatus Sumerlaeota bacterium]|nr:CIA30 family protein [Candidatus Sumerlaeota bacterium]